MARSMSGGVATSSSTTMEEKYPSPTHQKLEPCFVRPRYELGGLWFPLTPFIEPSSGEGKGKLWL
ncbi:unnamed protein product [Prunus armeniaca]|uniref:Uncharacterized protein n=1 Tax=Prunus armeniaca TaxID=36596 RepID=A0A6J5XM48_PRUAR|nr:unnamed protein product [Prunus armeniaca]